MKNKIYVGCSGFTGRDWKGIFYPEELPGKEQLTFYSTKFNAVEINSTFYRKPRQQTLEKWRSAVHDDFRYFIKIPKTITHILKLENTMQEVSAFCDYISEGLGKKLAGFLFQLPPSYHYSEENLQKVLSTVNSNYLNVIEFRHSSWWREDIFEILKQNNLIFSGVSYPKGISDEFITNHQKTAYYRLHGVPVMFKSEYTDAELQNLAEKIKESDRDVYVFFNNTWGTAALKNAQHLQELLIKSN